jgi:hypothetical protein
MKASCAVMVIAMYIPCTAMCASTPKRECLGYASVDTTNKIQLNLFSTDASHGGAMLLIDKGDPLYKEVQRHVGKLRLGKWKCVKSWPDVAAATPNPKTDATSSAEPRRSPQH